MQIYDLNIKINNKQAKTQSLLLSKNCFTRPAGHIINVFKKM